ncbi:MAG: uracil-DNA glycosylase [Phyllobacterium sp.]
MERQGKPETPAIGELIRFYADAGLDIALSDVPVDRFNEPPARQNPAPAEKPAAAQAKQPPPRETAPAKEPPPVRPIARTVVPDDAAIANAREATRHAPTLDALKAQLSAFDGCGLKFTAKNLVFADGNPQADIMFVGEAPGRDEDIEGLPFVGRSGQLLNRMLAAIDIQRTDVYIANTIPWRPPGNRTPTPIETEICRPFIERQIELVAPKILVSLGGPAAKVLTGSTDGILRMRGNWKTHTTAGGVEIPIMPTLHPAYLLRNPAQKRFAWRDLLAIKMRLNDIKGSRQD